jgi:hypothetical protein
VTFDPLGRMRHNFESLTLAYALIINDYFPNQVSPGDQTRVASGPLVTLQKKSSTVTFDPLGRIRHNFEKFNFVIRTNYK